MLLIPHCYVLTCNNISLLIKTNFLRFAIRMESHYESLKISESVCNRVSFFRNLHIDQLAFLHLIHSSCEASITIFWASSLFQDPIYHSRAGDHSCYCSDNGLTSSECLGLNGSFQESHYFCHFLIFQEKLFGLWIIHYFFYKAQKVGMSSIMNIQHGECMFFSVTRKSYTLRSK